MGTPNLAGFKRENEVRIQLELGMPIFSDFEDSKLLTRTDSDRFCLELHPSCGLL